MRAGIATGARAAALLIACAGPALAQDEGSLGDFNDRYVEPPSLPQSFNGVIRPREGAVRPSRVDTLREIGLAIQACWEPTGDRHSGQEITIRVSFKRSGEVLGKPMVTHYRAGSPEAENRRAFTDAVRDAFARCSPMPFTPTLGAAVAGRLFTFRFVDAPASKVQSL